MKGIVRILQVSLAILVTADVFLVSRAPAQSSNFHNAPESAKALKNPYQGQPTPHAKALFHLRSPAAMARMAKVREIFLP